METIVALDWDPIPLGTGPEVTVDNYILYISSSLMSEPLINVTDSPPVNITLDHNVLYSISLTALNCAGESENQTRQIKIGKCEVIRM